MRPFSEKQCLTFLKSNFLNAGSRCKRNGYVLVCASHCYVVGITIFDLADDLLVRISKHLNSDDLKAFGENFDCCSICTVEYYFIDLKLY